MHSEPRFLLAGDAALVVEFGNKIDEEINHHEDTSGSGG